MAPRASGRRPQRATASCAAPRPAHHLRPRRWRAREGRLPEAVRSLLSEHPAQGAESLGLIDRATSVTAKKVGADVSLSPSVASSQQVLFFKDEFMAKGREGLTGYDAS